MKMARASSLFCLAAVVVAMVAVLDSSCVAQSYVPPPRGAAAVSCNVIIPLVVPCRQFLTGSEPDPSKACCNGVKSIKDMLRSKQDRIDACNCIKQALSILGKYDANLIPLIPRKCNFSLSLPVISKNTNCPKVVRGGF